MFTASKKLFLIVLAAALLLTSGAAFAFPAVPQGALSLGDYGEEVVFLQKELQAAGFYFGEATGLYDEATRTSVATLQTLLGVRPDGKFGIITYYAYMAALEQRLIIPSYPVENEASLRALSGVVIGIDPGHQAEADIALERVSPFSDVLLKPRMSGGAVGVKTGTQESLINLLIAEKLQKLLSDAGATVVMSRISQEVSVSNAERAALMNQSSVSLWIRLHCDASTNANVSGACVLTPSSDESPSIYNRSLALAQFVLGSFCASTGAKNLGVFELNNQTGFNWSQSPVVTLEMGHLSNACDDVRLNRDAYQNACAQGILGGIAAYLEAEQVLNIQ